MEPKAGIGLGLMCWAFAGASFFMKPLFGDPLSQLGQIMIICTGCICVAIGSLEKVN